MQQTYSIPDDLLDVLIRKDSDAILDGGDEFPADFFSGILNETMPEPGQSEIPMFGSGPQMNHLQNQLQNPLSASAGCAYDQGSISGSGGDASDFKRMGSELSNPAHTLGGSFPNFKSENQGLDENGAPVKKRSRNSAQMEMNRIAQKQYRERKKKENEKLQSAVDQLTAEMANLKAAQQRIAELEAATRNLELQRMNHSSKMVELEQTVCQQAAMIQAQEMKSKMREAMLAGAAKTIQQQQDKLKEQEETICSLKAKLEHSIEYVWQNSYSNGLPGMNMDSCRRAKAAVMESLRNAHDIHTLEATLAMVPEECVVKICENIVNTFQDLSPQMASLVQKYCARANGGNCPLTQAMPYPTPVGLL